VLSNPVAISPHVATGNSNVATGSFSRSCILVERSNKLHLLEFNSLNCGDIKEFVATKVVIVTTETFWLDSAALKDTFYLIRFKVL
jgi:hypothetical protein